jgi:peroxiredoxin Q/BCP
VPTLAIGATAPEFDLPSSSGGRLSLSELRGRPVVLYFFPKSFTAGCTRETKEFAALAPILYPRRVAIVGISVDSAETQGRFAEACRAPFPILSDSTKATARAYGVLSAFGVAKRVTFFLDEQGVVRDIVAGLLPGPHLARARERFGPGD